MRLFLGEDITQLVMEKRISELLSDRQRPELGRHLPICLRCTTLKFFRSCVTAALLFLLSGEGTRALSKAPTGELFLGPSEKCVRRPAFDSGDPLEDAPEQGEALSVGGSWGGR